MPTSLTGQLCTDNSTARGFLERFYNPRSGSLDVPRDSSFWDAVESAHAAGKRGAGQRVGVLDTDFDLSAGRLADRAEWAEAPSSGGPINRGHGTAVSLLVNEVAPDAALVLHDVRPGRFVHVPDVVRGIEMMGSQSVDVLNLSLGFETEARRKGAAGSDINVITDLQAADEAVKDVLNERRANGGFFEDGGCSSSCPICDAIAAIPGPLPALVGAAGNLNHVFCPAAHHRCVGVGFHVVERVDSGGNTTITSALPAHEQNVLCEFVIAQPAGFEKTSFAAPLLAGLLALDGSAADLELLVSIRFTVDLVLKRREELAKREQAGQASFADGRSVNAAYWHVLDALPDAHRHWERRESPCAICAVLLLDAYRGMTQTNLGLGDLARGAFWADAASRVCPLSPDVMTDRAVLLRMQADQTSGDARRLLLDEAISCYTSAADRRPSDAGHVDFCNGHIAATKSIRSSLSGT